ncbi:MAG: DnaJ domain-containing protein [Gammaproteobacteria bacterium]|nr:DnaJ domain-containing protein [Gammaproteobacteria bacterium]
MKSRRNFYRLLRVQPDASLEIIKLSYRTLMQKLHHHPDLGGDEWNASHINAAYATLRNPAKRATYDRKLFTKSDIETVSRGHLGKTPHAFKVKRKQSGSRRNYYRVLQVQPDAELVVIEASYKLLKRNPQINHALLEEAWKTLNNKVKRRQYDQYLIAGKKQNTANNDSAGAKPKQPHQKQASGQNQEKPQAEQRKKNASSTEQQEHQQQRQANTNNPYSAYQAYKKSTHHNNAHAYGRQAGQQCFFCKTPYSHNGYAHQHEYCDVCRSPLILLEKAYENVPRRSVARAKVKKPAAMYTLWPSQPERIALSDVSPTGLSFISKKPLVVGSRIKIDAEDFKAIAELKYCKAMGPFSKIGVRFITIQFIQQRGSFVSTSA